jgi:hypothetical protein
MLSSSPRDFSTTGMNVTSANNVPISGGRIPASTSTSLGTIPSITAAESSSQVSARADTGVDRATTSRPSSLMSMSPHDVFPPRGSPTANSGPHSGGVNIPPSFNPSSMTSLTTHRLSGASISSQDVLPPRTLSGYSGSASSGGSLRRTSGMFSGNTSANYTSAGMNIPTVAAGVSSRVGSLNALSTSGSSTASTERRAHSGSHNGEEMLTRNERRQSRGSIRSVSK